MESSSWRESILDQIRQRNKQQCASFVDVISAHNRLFDTHAALRQENEKLRSERLALPRGSIESQSVPERISILESKLLAKQEELTEFHRKRGENAQMVVDLNKKVQETADLLKAAEDSKAEQSAIIITLELELKALASKKTELETLNQLIRDEHTALQLAYSHLEDKLRKTQDENRELVDRLMRYKSKDAEKMNEENDAFVRKRYLKIQKELEEAAKDSSRNVNLDTFVPDIPYSDKSAVPTKPTYVFDAHEGEVSAVKWCPVDRVVATGGADRKIRLWDTSKNVAESRGVLVGSSAGVMSVNFDTTGSYILGASNDQATRVWGVGDQRLKHTLTGHCGKVLAAKFLGEPTKVVTGSHDRTLKIWDLRSRCCVDTKFAGSCCNDLVISDSSGTTIISGHFDKKIRFWDTRTNQTTNEILVLGKVTSLDLNRDGKTLLSCVRDDTLRLIDLRTNQILTTYSAEGFKVGCDWTRAVFSYEGDFVAVGSSDGGVYVWNVSTGQLHSVLKYHTSAVISVSWHPFANYIASVDRSKKAVVWTDV